MKKLIGKIFLYVSLFIFISLILLIAAQDIPVSGNIKSVFLSASEHSKLMNLSMMVTLFIGLFFIVYDGIEAKKIKRSTAK